MKEKLQLNLHLINHNFRPTHFQAYSFLTRVCTSFSNETYQVLEKHLKISENTISHPNSAFDFSEKLYMVNIALKRLMTWIGDYYDDHSIS